jgi:sugar lactone lactonase YvrE
MKGEESSNQMRISKFICCAVGLILAATAAWADETLIVSNVLGPEGPLYIDGNLYYVGWVSNTLSKWDGKTATVLNHTPGCGHNGLALTKRKTFLLACTEELGAILELDMTGKQLRRWDADKNGKPFDGGINDIVVTANGAAYATVFGPYKDLPTSVVGKILYLAPGSQQWVEVAGDLNYANGIGVSPDQNRRKLHVKVQDQ